MLPVDLRIGDLHDDRLVSVPAVRAEEAEADLGSAERDLAADRLGRSGETLEDRGAEREEEGEEPEADTSAHAARRIACLLASLAA